jgi:aminoglycoside 3-N-acetyltransferase
MAFGFASEQLAGALDSVGVGRSDVLFVHSSLMHLGRLAGVSLTAMPDAIRDLLLARIGSKGTLAAPAPNWDYGRKAQAFDLTRSPVTKELGVLSAAICKTPGARRSPNPIFSVAAIGARADEICAGGTTSAFGYDSAWDRLYRADADILFLGCDLTYLTLIRYIEMRFGVPYLYTKLFRRAITDDGRSVADHSTALLRYMHCPVEYGLDRFQDRLAELGVLRRTTLGAAPVFCLSAAATFDAGIAALKEDIHYFLASPPDYRTDQVPLL